MPRPSPANMTKSSAMTFPLNSQLSLTPVQQQHMQKLYSFSDISEMYRVIKQTGWSATEEIQTLIDIARNSEKVRDKLSAINVLHQRRMEALQLSGTIIQATQTMTRGKKTTTVTTQLVNPTARGQADAGVDPQPIQSQEIPDDSAQIVSAQPGDTQYSPVPSVSTDPAFAGPRPAYDAKPKCADTAGMRGLAYHHTARRVTGGQGDPGPQGGPDILEDGIGADTQDGSEGFFSEDQALVQPDPQNDNPDSLEID